MVQGSLIRCWKGILGPRKSKSAGEQMRRCLEVLLPLARNGGDLNPGGNVVDAKRPQA